jgi:hypothetical protein
VLSVKKRIENNRKADNENVWKHYNPQETDDTGWKRHYIAYNDELIILKSVADNKFLLLDLNHENIINYEGEELWGGYFNF